MKKRTLALAALTAAMTLGMSLTSFAAEEPTWIVPKDTPHNVLSQTYGTDMWWQAEAVADCRAWAEANNGDIVGIQDEMARYTAIVNKVCGFLTYDINYKNPHIAYTIRDKKGVCSDYTALTLALCEKCNIKAEMSMGVLNGAEHNMVKVTLNGAQYYSDPTNYDSGVVGVLGMTPGYTEQASGGGLVLANGSTGADTSVTSNSVTNMDAASKGKRVLGTAQGVVYITEEDGALFDKYVSEGNSAGVYAIFDKYGIKHN